MCTPACAQTRTRKHRFQFCLANANNNATDMFWHECKHVRTKNTNVERHSFPDCCSCFFFFTLIKRKRTHAQKNIDTCTHLHKHPESNRCTCMAELSQAFTPQTLVCTHTQCREGMSIEAMVGYTGWTTYKQQKIYFQRLHTQISVHTCMHTILSTRAFSTQLKHAKKLE